MNTGKSDLETIDQSDRPSRGTDMLRRLLEVQAFQILLILIVILVVFSLLAPEVFPTWANARQVLQNMAILGVMGIGMTFVIITAGIDLSIGAVLVFSGVIASMSMRALGSEGWGVAIVGAIVAVGCGAAWGVLNGVIIAKMKVPPFIVTLGTYGAALGLALVITGGEDIKDVPSVLASAVGYGNIPGTTIPIIVLITTVLFIAFGILLHRTQFGLHVFAIGSSEEASRRVGVKVDQRLILVYMISGALAGFAGILSLATFNSTAISGQGQTNLSVISAVVIGGTSLFGGIGTVFGTAVGLSIPAVLQDGFIITGVEPFWQLVAVGVILILAVYIDQRRRQAAARGGRAARRRAPEPATAANSNAAGPRVQGSPTPAPEPGRPVLLQPNFIAHQERGGHRIAALRGLTLSDGIQSEEWLGSTTALQDDESLGLSRALDGSTLQQLVAADHEAWVGQYAAQTESPADTGILFRLLDVDRRLPVQVHPDRAFARRRLNAAYGKTEAWLILEAAEGSVAYLGWKDDVSPAILVDRNNAQDDAWLLANLNRIEVRPGMAILVPAGTPHSIGEGVLAAAIQEPTQYSIVLERASSGSSPEQSRGRLGLDTAIAAVTSSKLSPDLIAGLLTWTDLSASSRHTQSLLPVQADPYFRLDLISPANGTRVEVDRGYAVAVALSGAGQLRGRHSMPMREGDVVAIPDSFGPWTAEGEFRLLLARPGTGWPRSLAMPEPIRP